MDCEGVDWWLIDGNTTWLIIPTHEPSNYSCLHLWSFAVYSWTSLIGGFTWVIPAYMQAQYISNVAKCGSNTSAVASVRHCACKSYISSHNDYVMLHLLFFLETTVWTLLTVKVLLFHGVEITSCYTYMLHVLFHSVMWILWANVCLLWLPKWRWWGNITTVWCPASQKPCMYIIPCWVINLWNPLVRWPWSVRFTSLKLDS